MATDQGSGSGAALLSCDVFDTVLTRVVGTPSALFLILGKRLAARGLIRGSAEAFARARIEANRRARANAGRGVGLADIYNELQFALGLTDAERDAIRAAELGLEAELLRPVPGAAERLAQARAEGLAVAFLSDMYLDSAFIRGQLARHGLLAEGDGCYISCEAGCGKEDGRGYRLMAQAEGVALGRMIHRGNDPVADVAAARAVGIEVEPFLEGNLNRYEKALDSHSYATEGLSSVMAGAARLARLSIPASGRREVALRDVAASVGGPMIVSYVMWLLLRARQLGKRRLYFLAPDASILMRVAESLVPRLGLECEVRYLHGGREAWQTERQPEALAYFRQEGLFDDGDWGVVDVGWSGNRLGPMNRILGAGGREIPAAFSFARLVEPDPRSPAHAVPTHTYFSDHPLRRGHRGRLNEVYLNVFGGADHGATVGYERDADLMVPILASDRDRDLRSWGRLIIHETILSFVDGSWLDPGALDLEVDMRPAIADVLRMFFGSPSAAEARAWGTYPFDPGDDGVVSGSLAKPLSIRQLPGALRHGRITTRGNEWREGSLAITPPVTRALLRSGLAIRNRLARLVRP